MCGWGCPSGPGSGPGADCATGCRGPGCCGCCCSPGDGGRRSGAAAGSTAGTKAPPPLVAAPDAACSWATPGGRETHARAAAGGGGTSSSAVWGEVAGSGGAPEPRLVVLAMPTRCGAVWGWGWCERGPVCGCCDWLCWHGRWDCAAQLDATGAHTGAPDGAPIDIRCCCCCCCWFGC